MASHPYAGLPAFTRWTRAVADTRPADVDPAIEFPFKISAADRVATAGSCFAQHIARHLKKNDFNYYVVETGHPIGQQATRDAFNYGVYSARYGNIYTSRQLAQLLARAYGEFTPAADAWRSSKTSGFIDPFRPTIQPNGFASLEELHADRRQHLRLVREMFEKMDYFIFTLGLTEMWYDRSDGAAFPICPGVAGGEYDESKIGFCNLLVSDIVADLKCAVAKISEINPKARIILTVSPVPLAATALTRHVLVSTTYSKSALRAAAEEVANVYDHVAYFPSYEIITGGFNRGAYFAPDLRSVTEEGVEHVMRLFMHHGTDMTRRTNAPTPAPDLSQQHLDNMARVVQTLCDEEMLARAGEEASEHVP